MSQPQQTKGEQAYKIVQALASLVLAGAVALAVLMVPVCLFTNQEVIYWLIALVFCGGLASEMVEVVGGLPKDQQLALKCRWCWYYRSFNHGRFLWRCVAWTVLAGAANVLPEILSAGAMECAEEMNDQLIWRSLELQRKHILLGVPITIAGIGVALFFQPVQAWVRQAFGDPQWLKLDDWALGLLVFGIAAVLIALLFFVGCSAQTLDR